MKQSSLPEHLKGIGGLKYSPAEDQLSGQMAIVYCLATLEDRRKYDRKARRKNTFLNQPWLIEARELAAQLNMERQMQIEYFKAVVRKYPEKRVVLYSLSTYQVVPNGEI